MPYALAVSQPRVGLLVAVRLDLAPRLLRGAADDMSTKVCCFLFLLKRDQLKWDDHRPKSRTSLARKKKVPSTMHSSALASTPPVSTEECLELSEPSILACSNLNDPGGG